MAWPNFLRWGRKSAGSLGGLDVLLDLLNRQHTSAAGKLVTVRTAVEVATVFACLRVIGEGIAQVPLQVMQETTTTNGKTTRIPARKHDLYDVLALQPNAWQTSFEYREMLAMHAALCGNAYSFINRVSRTGSGTFGQRVVELIPFEPGQVVVKRDDNDFTLTYEVTSQSGSRQIFPAESIWHVRGPSWNSWMGLEAVTLAREAIGLAIATEEQQARMQKNGVRTSGVYSVEGTMKDDQYKALKAWIDREMAGSANAGSAMVLDRAAKWLPTSMTGVDAETLSTRNFQIAEICRHFRVNPIMVFAESKNTTYASAEQMFLAHVVHCLAPWYQRLEQSIDVNLLSEKDRAAGYYSNFVEEGLLRGSAVETQKAIVGYIGGGVITQNEGREKLDMNPDDDPESDKLHLPVNLLQPEEPAGDPAAEANAKAIVDLALEVKGISLKERPINIDARTTVNTAPAAPITVNVPEQKAADVRIEVAAPIVNVAPAQLELGLKIERDGQVTTTTYTRDPETKEIMSSITTKE